MLKNEEIKHIESNQATSLWSHALQLDWLGQMVASTLWTASVFVYGIQSAGDILQLCAALAWAIANIASLVKMQTKINQRHDSNVT